MVVRLLLAPASGGKTRHAIEYLRANLTREPLKAVWVVLPSGLQVMSIRRRLAESGGILGARILTFGELCRDLLERAHSSLPSADSAVTHRLTLAAINSVAARGLLEYFAPIQRRPGLARSIGSLIAEFKRSRVEPVDFSRAVRGKSRRLEEIALIYDEYQQTLIRLRWADPEGIGWLAVQALDAHPDLMSGAQFIVDGFDSFTPTQIQILLRLGSRTQELLLTLAGDPVMERPGFRRFERTFRTLRRAIGPRVEQISPGSQSAHALKHLEQYLFEPKPVKVDPGVHVGFVEAQTAALEAREALRWVKSRCVRDRVPLYECAVLARDLGRYRPFLRQAAQEFGLVLRIGGGEPLIQNPAIAAILSLLELSLQNWARRPVVAALRTPYFDLSRFGLSHNDAPVLNLVASWGQVVAGAEQWKEALMARAALPAEEIPTSEDVDATAPALPSGIDACHLWDRFSAWIERVIPPESGPIVQFVEWVEDLLSLDNGFGVFESAQALAGTAERDIRALVALRQALRSLVLSEDIVGRRQEVTWREFYQELRSAIQSLDYSPEDLRGRLEQALYVLPLASSRGVSWRAVVIIGLSEGLFPAPLEEDPLLSDVERKMLAEKGLDLEPRLRSDQQTLFYEGVTRAREYLLLTRPSLADDGEAWEPSPYWTAALAVFDTQPIRVRAEDARPPTEAASPSEVLISCVRSRSLPATLWQFKSEWKRLRYAAQILNARLARMALGDFEGDVSTASAALARRYGPAYVWSASKIEAFADCPFRFYIGNALELEQRKIPVAGYDASQLGTMLHEILQRTYADCHGSPDLKALLAGLPRIAHDVFDAAPLKLGFRPTALWDKQRAELTARLVQSITELEAQANDFKAVYLERRFGMGDNPPLAIETPAGPLYFRGVIDRIDVNARNEIRIIDYKTGSSDLDTTALREGRRLQIVIYALAAHNALRLGKITTGFYWAILKGKASELRLDTFHYHSENDCDYRGVSGAIDLTRKYLAADILAIREGRLSPQPPRAGCAEYCPAQPICWRYAPS